MDLSLSMHPAKTMMQNMKLACVIADDDHVPGYHRARGGIEGSLAGNRLLALTQAAAPEVT